jgi:hypothetical protein
MLGADTLGGWRLVNEAMVCVGALERPMGSARRNDVHPEEGRAGARDTRLASLRSQTVRGLLWPRFGAWRGNRWVGLWAQRRRTHEDREEYRSDLDATPQTACCREFLNGLSWAATPTLDDLPTRWREDPRIWHWSGQRLPTKRINGHRWTVANERPEVPSTSLPDRIARQPSPERGAVAS